MAQNQGKALTLVTPLESEGGSPFTFVSTIDHCTHSSLAQPYMLYQAYLIYTVAFVLGVYCNMRALENSNVETVIIFRSCTPIAVAVCDFLFMGRELPSKKSSFSLFVIAAGKPIDGQRREDQRTLP